MSSFTLKIPNREGLSDEEFMEQFVIINNLEIGSKMYSFKYNEAYTVKYIQDKWIWLEEEEDKDRYRIGSYEVESGSYLVVNED